MFQERTEDGERAAEIESAMPAERDEIERQVRGWSGVWRKYETHGTRILEEATRLGQRPACLAGLIRSTRTLFDVSRED